MRLVPIDQLLIDEATAIAAQFYLRGAGALYVAVAKHLAIPLVTFDHEQLTRPAAIISTIQP
jgi:predicted nucleic acid-binding protein